MDDYEKALSAYLVVIKIDPQDGEVWKEIGDIYLQTFLFEEAVYYYEEAFRLEPLQENLPLFLAMCYYKLGNINSMAHYMALAEQRTDMARQVFLDVFPEAASVLKQLSNN
jgi:tetratricopeptide (TPR) repeat protein